MPEPGNVRDKLFIVKLLISATDGSEGAERAVAIAAELAKVANCKLLIVNVSADKLSPAELRMLDELRVSEGDALDEISRRILTKATATARGHGATNIETMSGAGDPAKVLIDIVNNEHADAIVVGRRSHGQLEGLLLGSVSQKLSCLAPCAVIIIP
jgi:nucleotide-binding universal stress UspA family protein